MIARDYISQSQHGFQAGISTTTALVQIVERVLGAFDGGESARLTMLDLSRAFDLVDHEMLLAILAKLQHYGVRGVSNQLLRSYLTGRIQRVKFNSEISKFRINSMGVPQGSILGPLLFVIFLNDLPAGVGEPSVCLYADDTSFLAEREHDVVELAAGTTVRMEEWFLTNRLKLNQQKTQSLVFNTRKNPAEKSDFLGFRLDSTLSFGEHIRTLAKKLLDCITSAGKQL